MVKRKTRKFRNTNIRKTRKQKGGDIGVIVPFLAVVAVCAAASSARGLSGSAFKGEIGSNLSKGLDVNIVKPAKLKKIKEAKPCR